MQTPVSFYRYWKRSELFTKLIIYKVINSTKPQEKEEGKLLKNRNHSGRILLGVNCKLLM